MRIRGAIFDMDGTLLDSMPMWRSVAYDYLTGIGVKAEPSLHAQLESMRVTQAVEYCVTKYDLGVSKEQALAQVWALIRKQYQTVVSAKPGIKPILQQFCRARIPMCVATATERSLSEPALTATGLLPYFKGILTCAEVNASKEGPKIYLHAADFLGVSPSECLVFEDAPFAVQAAKSAGFPVVGVYDATFAQGQDQIRALSDFYVTDYRQADALLSLAVAL